jgi:hypothetical protein
MPKGDSTLVPHEKGLNFTAHMGIFMRWMAVRYCDPAFRDALAKPLLEAQREADEARQQWQDAESEFNRENIRLYGQKSVYNVSAADQQHWHDLLAKKQAARQRYDAASDKVSKRYYTSLWERLEQEASMQTKAYDAQKVQESRPDAPRPIIEPDYWDGTPGTAYVPPPPSEVEIALVEAWKKGLSGADPLPKEVMTLFDLLVHDTLLTSWQDHLLAPRLYFTVRSTDTFGETDFKDEARKREHEQQAIRRIDQISKIGDARQETGLDGFLPI